MRVGLIIGETRYIPFPEYLMKSCACCQQPIFTYNCNSIFGTNIPEFVKLRNTVINARFPRTSRYRLLLFAKSHHSLYFFCIRKTQLFFVIVLMPAILQKFQYTIHYIFSLRPCCTPVFLWYIFFVQEHFKNLLQSGQLATSNRFAWISNQEKIGFISNPLNYLFS